MGWHGRLELDHRLEATPRADDADRTTIGRARHAGPLRVLRSLYPEGPRVCHQVLVHPPGGIAGGDELELSLRLAPGSHALVTTPGATRFYRSDGAVASQTLDARVADGARLEWLPLETLVHDGARAHNRLRFALAEGAEMIGWDLLALGLPASGLAFERGRFEQRIEVDEAWLERSLVDFDAPQAAATRRRLASPLGWGGHAVLATLWFASGRAIDDARRERLLEAARTALPPDAPAGTTAPNPHVVVARALAARVEPLMQHARAVWSAWREAAWRMSASAPRVWRT
ncbi:MAG TPA: urease accessory protein UreD [Methylibium sp.]|uniref:urease accessory protein UreD n=1 Tax=Methylibium sp. TaxID=2067992 RepID=UPI002DBF1032|nr:urease accessory protein UreD [Methylibium sp.]HEU4460686.1 urease accessory protein UreD [Methylibium sp.]